MDRLMKQITLYFKQHSVANQEKLRNEFLPEALEIIEKPTSPIGPFMIIITFTIIVVFTAWSFIGKIDTVATARGNISTVSGIQNIQSEKGGIISEICVKEGDEVTAGQAIFKLDSSIDEITLSNLEEGLELLEFENMLL